MDNNKWTIMVYLAGDNNLSVDMAHAMEQIKHVAGQEGNGTNLLVYFDGNSKSIPTLYCDFSDAGNPKQFRSMNINVENKLYRVERKRNENAADYRSVLNFVDWCVNTRGRRAEKYGLIFSGHSLGFNDLGLFKDEASGKTMRMEDMFLLVDRLTRTENELATATEPHDLDSKYEKNRKLDPEDDADWRHRTTVLLGQPLDILGFDSCVMSMLEVGYQFKTNVKTMIASEGSIPSAGWTYAKILGSLAQGEKPLDDNQVAARFVTEFIKSQDAFIVGGASVDMAAWDMAKLDGLNEKFATLAQVLKKFFESPKDSVYRHMERALLQVHWKCQTYMQNQNVDLGDFCELLRDECASLGQDLGGGIEILTKVQEACDGVLTELNNVVILSGFSGGEYQYSNGISLYFPWSQVTYRESEKDYERLKFVKNGAGKTWSKFLELYLGEVTLRPSEKPAVSLAAAAGAGAGPMQPSRYRYEPFLYTDDERSSERNSVGRVEDGGSKGGDQSASKGGDQSASKGGDQSASKGGDQSASKGGDQSASKGGDQSASKGGDQSASKGGDQSASKGGDQSASKGGDQSASKGGDQSASKGGDQSASKGGDQSASKGGDQSASKGGDQSASKGGDQSASKGGDQSASKGGDQSASKGGDQSASKGGDQSASKGGDQSASKGGDQSASKGGDQSASKGGDQSASKGGDQSASKGGDQSGSKLGGGSGGNAFFDSLRLFKNIESRWNVSGFTKKPAESESDADSADATHG